MAAELGRRLLGECVEGGLDEVLNSLRILARQEDGRDTTQASVLDRLLANEQVLQLQHVGQKPHLPVLEISSENSGAGKSQLLYLIVATAVLPDVYGPTILEGKDSAVVFIDTEDRFDVQRLAKVMTSYIATKSTDSPVEDVEALVERSLRHVHVLQPQTIASLLSTLSDLKDYLFDPTAHMSSHRPIHSIILDSASAFLWQTRAERDTERTLALDSRPAMAAPPAPHAYAQLVYRLRSLSHTFNCAIIATTLASQYRDHATGETSVRTLPAPWPGFPTLKISVRREEVKKFAVGMSCEDALRERGARQVEVEKGVCVVRLVEGREIFRFWVTGNGVGIAGEEGVVPV